MQPGDVMGLLVLGLLVLILLMFLPAAIDLLAIYLERKEAQEHERNSRGQQ